MANAMQNIIYNRIKSVENITFSEFMDLALYHPTEGYYTSKRQILGKNGDFYTSAHVGTIMGEVLALSFINEVYDEECCKVVEFGAGDGRIANSFLDYLSENYPQAYTRLTFYIIEISSNLRKKQAEALSQHIGKVIWIESIAEIAPFQGMIYCNEYLDALPIHVIKYFKEGIKEKYLSIKNEKIIQKYLAVSEKVEKYKHFLPRYPAGTVTEFCPHAINWLYEVYSNSKKCSVYIIDYGYTFLQKMTPQRRKNTTIRTFKNHKIFSNPLAEIGKRDLTADVDFTTLQNVARNTGFSNTFFGTQSKFIMQSGILEKLTLGKVDFIGDPHLEQKLHHLKQLLFPGAMGEAFNVLKLTK